MVSAAKRRSPRRAMVVMVKQCLLPIRRSASRKNHLLTRLFSFPAFSFIFWVVFLNHHQNSNSLILIFVLVSIVIHTMSEIAEDDIKFEPAKKIGPVVQSLGVQM